MKHAVPLFLEDDTIAHLDWLAKVMAKQGNQTVSRSEAIEFLVRQHWKKVMKHQAKKRPVAQIAV